jgi:hypothetical protein
MKCENCGKRKVTAIVWDGTHTLNVCGYCARSIKVDMRWELEQRDKNDYWENMETEDNEFIKQVSRQGD